MTRVTVHRDTEGQEIKLEGHATGSPEVCAAVSGLFYALAGYLENSGAEHRREDRPGYAVAWAERTEATDAAFDMAVIGLRQIEQHKPAFLKVLL